MTSKNLAYGHFAGVFRHISAERSSARQRKNRRVSRPGAEVLEGRTLLSIGLDPTYGFGGEAVLNIPPTTPTTSYNSSIAAIAPQNGLAVSVGTLTLTSSPFTGSSTTNLTVSRFLTTGSVDGSFGSAGSTNIPLTEGGVTYTLDGSSEAIAVQTNGIIDVAAIVTPASASSDELLVVQLTPNGAIEGAGFVNFGSSNTISGNTPSIAVGLNGKIDVATTVVSSTTSQDVFAVAQLTPNLTLDTTFDTTGYATVAFGPTTDSATANGLVVQPNGSVVVVGQADVTTTLSLTDTLSDIAVARLTPTGVLDTTFNGTGTRIFSYNLGGTSSDSASAVTLVGSTIVIAGSSEALYTSSSTSYTPNVNDLTVTELNTDGSFDTSFDGTGRYLMSLAQGGITFNTYSSNTYSSVPSSAITALSDGSIIIGGYASEQNTDSYNSLSLIAKLTPAGALDTTYGTGGVALLPGGSVDSLFVQTDGKVVFDDANSIFRTTPPTLAVTTTTITTGGTVKNPTATAVTITFNTAINPTLAGNIKIYALRGGKPKKVLKIKHISFDSTDKQLTFTFAKTKIGKGFQIVITPGAIVAADGNVLSGGGIVTITIPPTTTT
jgi:uncharacterized delta-60 repeat protein